MKPAASLKSFDVPSRNLPHKDSVRSREQTRAYRWACTLLLGSVVLQKFAVPGTGNSANSIPLSLVLLLLATASMVFTGCLLVSPICLTLLLLFLCEGAISFVLSDSLHLSIASLALVCLTQIPFTTRFPKGDIDYRRVLGFMSALAQVMAAIGLLQFAMQFVFGRQAAFPIEALTPETMVLSGFNNIIPISWNSVVLKSNGIFFAEPSFFCQFLAIGLVVELLEKSRYTRLILIACGILTSFSGTGLIALAITLPILFIKQRRFGFFVVVIAACAILILMASSFGLNALVGRVSEFSNKDSSGYGRFFSPFLLVNDFILPHLQSDLIGRGPGTVREFWPKLWHGAFDPTWCKLLYEYGLTGFSLYSMLFYGSFISSRRFVGIPLVITYLFLGGYLADTSIIIPMLVLVAWPHADSHVDESLASAQPIKDAPRAFPIGIDWGLPARRSRKAGTFSLGGKGHDANWTLAVVDSPPAGVGTHNQ